MDFVNPWMLGGLSLAAIPVVLHLVMRARPKQIEFPALRFIRQRQEANRRKMRLRHLLLLALRAAAILLLASALARPAIRPEGGGAGTKGPVAAAMLFDTAPRMQYHTRNESRLEVAREMGLWVLDRLPEDSRIAVFETRVGVPVFQIDAGAARQRVERLKPVASHRPMGELVEDALLLLAEANEPRNELYVFTDLSRAAWAVDSAARIQQLLSDLGGIGIYIIDVGVEEPENFALGELRLSASVISQTGRLRLESEIACLGNSGERTIELYLDDGDRAPQKRSEQTVRVSDEVASGLEFSLGGLDVGSHQGHLRIVGQDSLAADDVRYFTVEVHSPWRLLIAASEPVTERSFVFTEALAPERFRKTGQARFICDVVSLGELERARLGSYAAVCLVDPAPLSPASWAQLSAYVAEGGGLAVLLGPAASSPSRFNTPGAKELLPAAIVQQARRTAGDVFLAPQRYDHPLLRSFAPLSGSIPWEHFPVFRYWQLGDLAEGARVIVHYADGRPALVERPFGRGRVLLLTTPLSAMSDDREPWNLLASGFEPWPFVMLANEMMYYACGSRDRRLNYLAGETAVVPLEESQAITTYVLSTPAGNRYRRTVDRSQHALVVPATDAPGNYRMQAGGAAGTVNRGFSVNLEPRATELARASAADLDAVFGPHEYQVARRREEITFHIDRGRSGRELYPFLILFVVIALALEHVVSNRFYRDDETDRRSVWKWSKSEDTATRQERSESVAAT